MPRSVSQKRPWLAALLAALVTGFGHLYLRRWRRAVGWLVLSVAATALFVDPAAIDEILAGTATPDVLLAVAPSLFITGLSVIDAYLLARAHVVQSQPPVEGAADTDDAISCPHCGKDVDPELDFCHWCTTRLDDLERERSDEIREP
ncbi:zinc ribbon domain-containing protein [Halopiger aswanensis]|uniref:DUF7575 domain-containing protein n=1 Tax=Halopiger aswanensis TaxID=148449 RepID=A0A3R7KJ99_9EURY|nr:zinc ribbon domain-containing protein [Halopiger aswanensis]RKD89288.1 hypothetical protein ATJ93_4121 [Halopiger aswanensis]